MDVHFDVPHITTTNPVEQNKELLRYIYQLVEKLNYAFSQIDKGES